MTAEHKIIIDFEDIRSIIVECDACKCRIGVPARQKIHGDKLLTCPSCNKSWLDDYTKAEPFIRLIDLMREVELWQNGRAFKIRFELDDPSQ
jgi:hypothetical protein